jgi:hypothetical protein
MQVDDLSYVGRIQQLRPDSLTRAASDALPRHLAEALDSDWPAIYLPFGTVLITLSPPRWQRWGGCRRFGHAARCASPRYPAALPVPRRRPVPQRPTCEAAGADIALIGADATTDRNAKRFAAEIAGLPSTKDAVTALEQLID